MPDENLMKIGILRKMSLFTDDIHEMLPTGGSWKTSLAKTNTGANSLANYLGNRLPEIRIRTQSKMSETNCGDEDMEQSPLRQIKWQGGFFRFRSFPE
jgi:hypothetical protein